MGAPVVVVARVVALAVAGVGVDEELTVTAAGTHRT